MSIGGVDRVIRPVMVALSAPRALRAVITLEIVIIFVSIMVVAMVVIIMAAITVVVVPVFTSVIIVALVVGGVGSPFSFFGVAYPFAICISSLMVVGLLWYNFPRSCSC